ncbi:hypothetical protein FN846DRAFT_919280 [Sphaerosporella brunnea]|uniref:Uncharacterized protein n=1 Tax=Sphaerosporella brunnea TaxID=1250544 RepID=A0A5J5EWW8_9PEZI|nr:hypothetical protein FN846DRAFT_919280 [Sphaerosporella brunnea]
MNWFSDSTPPAPRWTTEETTSCALMILTGCVVALTVTYIVDVSLRHKQAAAAGRMVLGAQPAEYSDADADEILGNGSVQVVAGAANGLLRRSQQRGTTFHRRTYGNLAAGSLLGVIGKLPP